MRPRNIIINSIYWFSISIMLQVVMSENTNRTKLTIGGLFSIYNHPGDISSSNIQIDSVKNLEAVKWVFRLLNDKNYIDGVDLDIVTEFTANSQEVASLKVGKLANGQTSDETCAKTEKGQVLAIIGPETSAEAMITSSILSSVPEEYRIPQVLFSTTSTLLNDTSIYKNTLRVIQADDTQIQAMIRVINESEWSMVAVIFEDRVSGINAANLFTSEVENLSVCVAKKYKISAYEESIETFKYILNDVIENNINGIVYFGRSVHTHNLLTAADSILKTRQTPAFLFSESAVTSQHVLHRNNVPHPSAKGAFVMSPPVLHIPEFRSHWLNIFSNLNSLHEYSEYNPYLMDVFENITGCRLISNNSSSCLKPTKEQLSNIIHNSLYSPFAIHSAFILAKTLKMLYKQSTAEDNCRNISYTDIQSELFNINIDYTEFHELGIQLTGWENKIVRYVNGKPEKEEYFVKNFRKMNDPEDSCPNSEFCLVKIAEYVSKPTSQLTFQHDKYRDYVNGVTEEPWGNRRVVQCPVGKFCEACVPNDLSSRVLYYPGELFVVATMPIHNKGTNPLKCSGIRSSIGFELALAIKWVIDEENERGKLFNKKIGLLLFDTCNDPLVIQEKLIQFYRNGQKVYGEDLSNRILGYVGPLGSGPTVAVANVVGKLNYPQVGCCSASSVLGDNNLFPTFLRLSSPLNRAVELMIEIAKKFKVNSIQIIYSEGEFGENGRDLTLKMAKENGICVKNNISISEREDNDYKWVYHELKNNAKARFVFVFIRSHVGPKFATSINTITGFEATQFRFLASDSWGNRLDNINGNWKLMGTISIAQEMRWDKDTFVDYLSELRPSVTKDCKEIDPFLTPFFQARLNCYLPWSFDKTYNLHPCSETDKLPGNNFEFDTWTPFVVNSVKVFLKGTSEAFKTMCDIKNETLCYEYVSQPHKVRETILNVKFNIDYKDGDDVIFDEYGGGVVGYVVYMADRDGNMKYTEIGEKRYGQPLSLNMDVVTKIIGKAGGQVTSKIDQDELDTCIGTHISLREKNQIELKLYVISGVLAVSVIINAVYLICIIKRRRQQMSSSESQHYIVPLHATS